MTFNTAISAMMVLASHLQSLEERVPVEAARMLALMVSPFAPHLGEECWRILGHNDSLAYHPWVKYEETLCVDDEVTMGVQVNGKARGQITIPAEADQETALSAARDVGS